MNVSSINDFRAANGVSMWANHKPAETTGSVANKQNDPLFKPRNAETTGAIAGINSMDGTQHQGGFMAVA